MDGILDNILDNFNFSIRSTSLESNTSDNMSGIKVGFDCYFCNEDVTLRNKPSVYKVGSNIFSYITPIIFVIGVVGNILSLLVFRSKKMRKLSASLYLAALSMSDISSLTFYVLVEWLRRGLKHISPETDVSFLNRHGLCQLLLYMAYISRLMSSWIIVVFTIERFMGVCYPLKSLKRGAGKILLTMFACSCLLVLYKPILSGEYTQMNRTVCTANAEYKFLSFALDGVFAITITLIPFTIITVLNILIVRKLFIRNKESRSIFSDNSTIRLEFTLILLAISFFFVAFNLPYSVVWARNFLHSAEISPSRTRKAADVEYWSGVLMITRTIFYMNYCINFFLYSITGKYFRTALVEMLSCHSSNESRYGSYIKCRRLGSTTTQATLCGRLSGSVKSYGDSPM
ncbi:C-C chemokine receptor type 1-like [Ruditapes philippinarum]|uniref:C-C chemokine receptor type 1-like n=1 Tax=Ruditapes philippinarum TaxID=129788 RepID=UPI00295B322C|nr:C-C chemokine receptor type 1-like [Ruditapes philippinarum]